MSRRRRLLSASAEDNDPVAMLQIAFATTVVGLFAGAVGYVILQARQRWFVADLASLEFIAGMTAQVSPTNAPQS